MAKKIYIYGLAGPSEQYRAIWYECMDVENFDIQWLRALATQMAYSNPSIKEIWALSARPGLRQDYLKSAKHGSIEDCLVFKDLCERYGLPIPFVRFHEIEVTKK